jgi:hypothetical protein
MTKKKTNEPKQYSLNELEKAMLSVMTQQHQALLSNFISFVSITRLGKSITDKTQFTIASDLSAITILEPEESEENAA